MTNYQPRQTLYINNLNEKVKRDEIKKALHAIFSQFGTVVDIMAFQNLKMRGQAHVIFKDVQCACTALHSMQGFPFYEKNMRIQFAREDSDVVAKANGSFVEKPKKPQAVKRPDKQSPQPAKRLKLTNEPRSHVPPHKILFVSNLPDDANDEMIRMVFSPFPGLIDIRLVPGRSDIAFVEFIGDGEATEARKTLNNFKITANHAIKVEYAKK